MQTATNHKTGERLYLSDEGWKPLVTATNPKTGARVYLDGDAWVPLPGADNEPDAPVSRGDRAQPATARFAPETVKGTEGRSARLDRREEVPDGPSWPDLGKRFVQGLVDVPASAAEANAIGQRNMEQRFADQAEAEMPERAAMIAEMEQRLADPSLRPEERAFIEGNLADLRIGQEELGRRATQDIAAPEDREGFERAERMRQWAADRFGVPEDDPSFLGALAGGAGSMVGFVSVALAGGLIGGGPGALAATAGAGSALNKSQVYREARDAGLEEQEAIEASRLAGYLGTLEAVPIVRALRVLPPQLRGEVSNQVVRRLASVAQAGGEEAVQEAVNGIGNNLIAAGYYDPERGVLEGVGEQALIGAILGGGVGAAGQVTQAGGGQAPPNPGSGGLPGGEASAVSPPRQRTETDEMAARIAARVLKEAPQPIQPVSTGQEAPPARPAGETEAVPALPVTREAPAQPQAEAVAPEAPVADTTTPEPQDAAPEPSQAVPDDAAPAQVPPVTEEGAAVEAGVEDGQSSPGRTNDIQFDAERTEEGYFGRVSPPEGGQRTFRDQAFPTREEAVAHAQAQWTARTATRLDDLGNPIPTVTTRTVGVTPQEAKARAQDARADEPQYDPLEYFSGPMPNHQPLWRSMPAPDRPPSGQIAVAGETVKLPPADKPIRREGIRLLVEQIIGQRVYTGKVRGKSVAGYYSRQNGAIRTKRFDDIEVLAHEMAHWLDFNSTQEGRFHAWRKKLPQKVKDEMGALSYTSDPGKVQVEGFAEFMRLWLTRYDAAERLAPSVTKEFNKLLDAMPPMKRRLGKLRSEMHAYYYQGAEAQGIANIGEDTRPAVAVRRFISNRPQEMFRQQAIDRLHGIKIAEREATGQVQDGAASAFKLMQLVHGAGGIYDAVVQEGTIRIGADGSIESRGKSLQKVLDPVTRRGWRVTRDFFHYATARRAQELMEQGRENLFSPQQIRALLAKEQDGFAKVFEDFQRFNAEMLDFYVESGLITPEQRAAFQIANQNYVPFFRIAEGVETGGAGGARINMRLTGGDRNLQDIGDNIVNGLFTNIRAAMIARAKARLYSQLERSDTGGAFAVRLAPDSDKVRVSRDDMARKVAEVMAMNGLGVSRNGIIVANPGSDTMTDVSDIARVLGENADLLELWRHNMPPTTQGTYVDSAIINGERRYYEVKDPVLIESVIGQQMQEQGIIQRAAIGVRRFQSMSITVMPPFFLPNAVRDTVTAAALSDSGFRPVVDTVRGMKSIVMKDPTYREWLRNGGGYSALVQQQAAQGRGRAGLALPAHTPMQYAAKAIAGLEGVAALFENGSRVGEYMRAIERGASKTEAAWRAREISTDFSQQPGNYGWANLLQTIPFANAALQGNDRLWRAFVGNEKGVFSKASGRALAERLTNKWGVSIAIFTAALWAINEDDERYQKLTPDEKGRFWHIWLPGEDRALRIPKPYGQGFLFADIVENTLDFIKTREGADTARNLAWAFQHHMWFMDYPGFIAPTIEDWKNETFTGAPVVPYWTQQRSPELQYRESTPEVYKKIGMLLGISPMRTQHYARGFFGYMETAFSQASELYLWDEDRYGARPFPNGLADYTFRQFRASPYPYRTKYTEGYYQLRERIRTASTDYSFGKSEAKKGRGTILADLSADEQVMFLASLNKKVGKIDRALASMRDEIEAVKYDRGLDRETKEARIEGIYRERDRLLSDTYRDLESAVRAMEGK